MIQNLIETTDTREQIVDQIVSILVSELANQRALATAEGKPTAPWDIRVFKERALPFEMYLDGSDLRPVVNVSFEDCSLEGNRSTVLEQQYTGMFQIDCLVGSKASGDFASDYLSAIAGGKLVTLVRSILMFQEYRLLNLPTFIVDRRVSSLSRLNFENPNTDINLYGIRMTLGVTFKETVPLYNPQALEGVTVTTEMSPSGEVIITEYNYN